MRPHYSQSSRVVKMRTHPAAHPHWPLTRKYPQTEYVLVMGVCMVRINLEKLA